MAKKYPMELIEWKHAPCAGEYAYCLGFQDGLPVFGYRGRLCFHPRRFDLATRSQLRSVGLRPGGDPVALLRFRHRKPFRREEIAELFLIHEALPKRPPTPAQLAALRRAHEVRRTCVECGHTYEYYVPTSTRQCWACFDEELTAELG